jgi:hypothetical protein
MIDMELNFQYSTNVHSEQVAPPDAKHLLPDVAWDAIADDDFVFRFGDYCLRVEQMNNSYWWWCVYYQDEYAGFDEPKAKTKLEAKLLAEICFVRHWSSHSK